MTMKRARAAIVVVGWLSLGSTLSADEAFLGRWNIQLGETGDTFRSSWLEIRRADSGLQGAMVWKWGGVTRLEKVEVVDGELRLRRGKESYRAKLVGDELHGSIESGKGKKLSFTGRRAPEMCDVSGTWKVVKDGDESDKVATIVLEERDGKIAGKATDPRGNSYKVKKAKLEGYVLAFQAVPERDDVPALDVRCKLRGDVIEGEASPSGGEDSSEDLRFTGRRAREWGEPVVLLKDGSIEGWRPRNPKRKFGWSVTGGVLENSPPDIDIVSEKKFRDFRLHLEYKVDNRRANSGVYLRGRYELQILGNPAVEPHGNMAVYSRLSPKKNPMRPLDQWQAIDVTFIGRWLTVSLNGETIHDNEYLPGITGGAIDPWEGEPGPLMLQGDHGKVRFRNITVTPVK